MKFITKHIKFIIAFVVSFALTLIFLEQLCELLLKISKGINYKSTSFKIGYFTITSLLILTYTISISKRYIHHTRTNLIILYTISIYVILRFILPSTIEFNPINSSIKYADIIIALAFLHLLNVLIVEDKFLNTKKEKQKKSYFIDDGLYVDGELDNEKILQKLIEVITDYKPEVAFSIGLNAVWGYGKSSFLHRFKNEYQAKNSNSIIFWNRIWKNKGSTAIIENFFDELKDNLSPYSAEIAEDINNYVDSVLSLSSSDLKKLISFGKQALSENATLEKFYSGINENIKKIDRQVIILLDDLDRLEKPEILNTFKLIRTLSDFNNVIFIAGYDRKYIVETIDLPKDNYLDKIFNVEINLLPFDEQLIVDELLRQVEISFPVKIDEKDITGYNRAFKDLFIKKQLNIADVNLNNFLNNSTFNCSNHQLKYQDFLKTYRDVKRFINEFKFNASFLENESDIVADEYIILKLLTYKYRDLQSLIFSNLKSLLKKGTIDTVNKKIEVNNFNYGDVYIYDKEIQEKLNKTLLDYKLYNEDDIEIINASLCYLFGEKSIQYYQENQNAISKIYYTDIYIRNNIFIGRITISKLQEKFEDNTLFELESSILENNGSVQLENELKQFIFNNFPRNKEQFLDSLKTLNLIIKTPLFSDNLKVIERLKKASETLYKDNAFFLDDLIELVMDEKKGYLLDLFSEINMELIRKESELDYSINEELIKTSEFLNSSLKEILLSKLKKDIFLKINPSDIYSEYLLQRHAIVLDKQILLNPEGNEAIKNDIKERFLTYFDSPLFQSLTERIEKNLGEIYGYSPSFFIGQIFSNPNTLNDLIINPSIELYNKFYEEGWINFLHFIESLEFSNKEIDDKILEQFDFMKKFVKSYIENGIKPLNLEQYDELWREDFPF